MSEPQTERCQDTADDATIEQAWENVAKALENAKAMHFDNCHKIYLSMDDEQVAISSGYGYDVIAPDLELIKTWFEDSCGLRFINAVYTDKGFVNLIPQGFGATDEDDEERA